MECVLCELETVSLNIIQNISLEVIHVEDILLMFLRLSNLTFTLGNSGFDFEQFNQYSTRR